MESGRKWCLCFRNKLETQSWGGENERSWRQSAEPEPRHENIELHVVFRRHTFLKVLWGLLKGFFFLIPYLLKIDSSQNRTPPFLIPFVYLLPPANTLEGLAWLFWPCEWCFICVSPFKGSPWSVGGGSGWSSDLGTGELSLRDKRSQDKGHEHEDGHWDGTP